MKAEDKFVFTSENLLDNLDKLGGWSMYGLASDALQHYFPEVYDNDEPYNPTVQQEVDLVHKLGLKYWDDVVRKYHNEVGYKNFNPECVNEY